MRLNLYWRGRDVIDVELHLWRKREDNADDSGPTLQASGGGQAERADTYGGDPATIAGFGFQRSLP